jgi:hypothetical protein
VGIAASTIVNVTLLPENGFPDARQPDVDLDTLNAACIVYLRQWYSGDPLPALVSNSLRVRFELQAEKKGARKELSFLGFYRPQV